jgi:hypothetical protein
MYQFIGMHTNQLDPDLGDITQNNKFCLDHFFDFERHVSNSLAAKQHQELMA